MVFFWDLASSQALSLSSFETFRLFAVFFERLALHLIFHINFSKGVPRTDSRSSKTEAPAKARAILLIFYLFHNCLAKQIRDAGIMKSRIVFY